MGSIPRLAAHPVAWGAGAGRCGLVGARPLPGTAGVWGPGESQPSHPARTCTRSRCCRLCAARVGCRGGSDRVKLVTPPPPPSPASYLGASSGTMRAIETQPVPETRPRVAVHLLVSVHRTRTQRSRGAGHGGPGGAAPAPPPAPLKPLWSRWQTPAALRTPEDPQDPPAAPRAQRRICPLGQITLRPHLENWESEWKLGLVSYCALHPQPLAIPLIRSG